MPPLFEKKQCLRPQQRILIDLTNLPFQLRLFLVCERLCLPVRNQLPQPHILRPSNLSKYDCPKPLIGILVKHIGRQIIGRAKEDLEALHKDGLKRSVADPRNLFRTFHKFRRKLKLNGWMAHGNSSSSIPYRENCSRRIGECVLNSRKRRYPFIRRCLAASNKITPAATPALIDSVSAAIGMLTGVVASARASTLAPCASLPMISAQGCVQSTLV